MTRPACHNRPPAPEGRWLPTGVIRVVPRFEDVPIRKPVYRWYRRWYADRCAAWDSAATTPPVPRAEGWACAGCRWLPEGAA